MTCLAACCFREICTENRQAETAEGCIYRPVLIDRFLEDAFEMDVDAVADGHDVVIGGIMEQIEPAGGYTAGWSQCAPARPCR